MSVNHCTPKSEGNVLLTHLNYTKTYKNTEKQGIFLLRFLTGNSYLSRVSEAGCLFSVAGDHVCTTHFLQDTSIKRH